MPSTLAAWPRVCHRERGETIFHSDLQSEADSSGRLRTDVYVLNACVLKSRHRALLCGFPSCREITESDTALRTVAWRLPNSAGCLASRLGCICHSHLCDTECSLTIQNTSLLGALRFVYSGAVVSEKWSEEVALAGWLALASGKALLVVISLCLSPPPVRGFT